MANIKVRLKDASGNVLHPETDWSVVLNRPSFNISNSNSQRSETWSAPITSVVGINTLYLASPQGSIMINDRTVGKNTPLADYPIKYSAISEKPSYLVDKKDMVFGHYSTVGQTSDGIIRGAVYPAIRRYDYYSDPQHEVYTYSCYYFNGTSWVKFDESDFTPSL